MLSKPSTKWITRAFTLVWIGTFVLPLVHAATESHRYCEAHGRFEEQHETATRTGAVGERSVIDATPESTDDHDACDLLATSSQAVVVFATSCIEHPFGTHAIRNRAHVDSDACAIPTWSIAPKQSPPV